MDRMNGHTHGGAAHHLPDFSAEDIETFLGGVLSQQQHQQHQQEQQHHSYSNGAPYHGAGMGMGMGIGMGIGMGGGDSADGTTGSENPSTGDHLLPDDHEPLNDADRGATDGQKAAVRTERKRCREKQRRSDVNRQFAELSTALRKVETESTDWARHTYTSTTNRADLIARSIYILNAVHEANESRKRRVVELERDLEQAKKAGEETAAKLKEQMMAPQQMGGGKMVMMVPMMIGGDSAPTPAMPYGQMPFYMPQPPPPAVATVVAGAGGNDAASGSSSNGTSNGSINANPIAGMATMAMPPYMMQHMMAAAAAAAAQQHQQSMMQQQQQQQQQQPNQLGGGVTVAVSSCSTGPTTAGDHNATGLTDGGKKMAATSPPDYTNNVAHLA